MFIDAARSLSHRSIPPPPPPLSPPMGLQRTASKLRSGYVEGGLRRGARYESPLRVPSFVTSSLKVHLPVLTCDAARREPGGARGEASLGGAAGGCATREL